MSVSSSNSLSLRGIYGETNQDWVDQLRLLTKKQALAMLATVPPQANHTHIYFILKKPTSSKPYYKLIDMVLYNKSCWPGVDVDICYEKIKFDPASDLFYLDGKCIYGDFRSFLDKKAMGSTLICVLEKLLNELTKPVWYIEAREVEEANKKIESSEYDLFYVVNKSDKDSFPIFTIVSKSNGERRIFYAGLTKQGKLIIWNKDHEIFGYYESFAEFRQVLEINGPIREESYSKLSPRMLQVFNHESLSSSSPG